MTSLEQLAAKLKRSLGIVHKQDIQIASQILQMNQSTISLNDCASI